MSDIKLSAAAKEMRREYHRQWRKENREHINNYHRQWREENREKVKEYNKRYWENLAKEQQEE